MTNSLTDVDRELLGEVSNTNRGEVSAEKANGAADHGAVEDLYGSGFTPLNATAGTLVKVNRKGDRVDADEVS